MSDGSLPGTIPSSPPVTGRRRWIPFWVLQLTELVVAFILVDISVHVSNSGLMVGAAVAFAALAITAHGPLGIFRICRPLLHLTLVIGAAVVVAVAPVIPVLRPDIEGIIVIEFGAIGLIRLATLTDMQPSSRARRSASSRKSGALVIDATATLTPDRSTPHAGASSPPSGDPEPGPPSSTGAAARWAGRAAGTASASSRRVVAKHRPEAEAKVKKAIREAGRLTGKVTSPPAGERTGAEGDSRSEGPTGDTAGDAAGGSTGDTTGG
jgi:hypothetical protein